MQMVGVMIGIVIALVVGVSLLPTIGNAIKSTAATDPLYGQDTTVITLAGLLPIIFVAMIILGAVGFMASKNRG